MGLIVALISAIACGVLYYRMYKRDLPVPLEKSKVILPAVLGLFSPVLSTLMLVVNSSILQAILGGTLPEKVHNLVIRSLIASFVLAGFTEEFVKFLVFMLVVVIVKPKKVYQYGLLCAGVGFGFTALETVLYGAGNVVTALSRLPMFAMHMVFGITMGLNIGLYKYYKQRGEKGAGKYLFMGLFLPVLWHTIFDAGTAANAGITSTDETAQMIAVIAALVIIVVSVILQIVVLIRFKKNSEKYCAMEIAGSNPRPDKQ